MPQEQAATEAEQLIVVATADRDLLTTHGLDPLYIDTLEARTDTFAYSAVQFDIHTKGISAFREFYTNVGKDSAKKRVDSSTVSDPIIAQ